ncbi:Flagellar L-ring protein [Thalassocella blandensis]|nr:Flagellar L-ring protein [Thalassocella blandensis]
MCLIALQGCVVHQPQQPNDPYFAPVMRTEPAADASQNGSLYRENVALGLFTDQKAMRIGDIITIILDERTTSTKSSAVNIKKENDLQIVPDGGPIFGVNPSLGSYNLATNVVSDRDFKGEADADQSNRLSGNISVTVTDIYPNGTLVVRGEKWMTLNRGSEFIRISGLVRPDDVTPENTILSTRIANARITYSGTGELADSQQMGWLTRFFNSPIWPF